MAIRYFGQDFTYDIYALQAGSFSPQVLPSTPDSVYLYDGFPTEDDAAAGATADGSYTIVEGPIAAWIDTPDARGKRVSFSAVDEPANLNGFRRKYYVVANITLDGAALSPVIRELTLERLRVQESRINVDVSDVLATEPMIGVEFPASLNDVDMYIDAAITEVQHTLNGCSRKYADYLNPGELKLPVIKLAISRFYLGQSQNPNDVYFNKGVMFKEEYNQALKRTTLEFDDDRDGKPEGVIKPPSGVKSLRILR